MARRTAKRRLTERQRSFAREYLVDLNGTQAVLRAGYHCSAETAAVTAYRLLRDPQIAALVANANAIRARKTELTAERVLAEIVRIAFSDLGEVFTAEGALRPIGEIPEDARRALASVETVERQVEADDGPVVRSVVRKVKLHDKLRALELAAKHLGLLAHDTGAPEGNREIVLRIKAGANGEEIEIGPDSASPATTQ